MYHRRSAVRGKGIRKPFECSFDSMLLGRGGGALYSGEDGDTLHAILREGGADWWVPGAGVRHALPPERLTVRYLRRMIACQGVAHLEEAGRSRGRGRGSAAQARP